MNIIFDFDGTLCDSLSVTIKSANAFLVKNNMKTISIEEVRQNGLKKIIKDRSVPAYKLPSYIKMGRKILLEKFNEVKSFPNLRDVVVELSREHTLGILTSNSEESVKRFLKRERMSAYFDFIYSEFSLFGKDGKIKKIIKKHSFSPNETFYIGDETRDIEAAHKARIKSVAVTWGFEKKELIKKSKPDYLVEAPAELLGVF